MQSSCSLGKALMLGEVDGKRKGQSAIRWRDLVVVAMDALFEDLKDHVRGRRSLGENLCGY